MRLRSFRVRAFRNVIDSGDIQVDDITCLVGKNEAGKSALLAALHRLNPATPVAFDLLAEYPRWLKKEHELTGQINDTVPIEAVYELTETEATTLEDQFGEGVLSSRIVVAQRDYAGQLQIRLELDQEAFLRLFFGAHIDDAVFEQVRNVPHAAALLKVLRRIAEEPDRSGQGGPSAAAASAATARDALTETLEGAPSLTQAVSARVRAWLPRTFFSGSYSQLRGRYDLDDVLAAVAGGTEDEQVQAAADFLELADVAIERLQDRRFEASMSELEAVSSLLTRRVREYWKQNQHLKLSVRIEDQPAPDAVGADAITRYLHFRVEDSRHDFSNPLDRRSTGFQWFVSFIASFFRFESDADLVLLLDEPGLSLHARAQMDLLDAIEERLAGDRQVIYTTHSPFMIRTDAIGRTQLVEDRGPEVGARVTDAGGATDPDTLFPLRAALGLDLASNALSGGQSLVVESVSDLIYLTLLSARLEAIGRTHLPEGCRVLPAGATTGVYALLAMRDSPVDAVVLLDGDAASEQLGSAVQGGWLPPGRVLSIAPFAGVEGAGIEDLFTVAEYLDLFNEAYSAALSERDLAAGGGVVERIARRMGGPFDRGRVATYLASNAGELLPLLTDESLERFEALMEAVFDGFEGIE